MKRKYVVERIVLHNKEECYRLELIDTDETEKLETNDSILLSSYYVSKNIGIVKVNDVLVYDGVSWKVSEIDTETRKRNIRSLFDSLKKKK